MLQILGRANSINVRKVLWTCAELGLRFERHDWGQGFQPTDTPEFLALNPNATVPVIQDGDFSMWESHAIIRYLAGAYDGARIYPVAPRTRAVIDQWLDWSSSELHRASVYAFLGLSRKSPQHADPAATKASCESWTRLMGILEQRLASTQAYVAGDGFTLADIPVGLAVNRWFGTPLERPALPAVAAYFERLSQRPEYLEHGRNGLP
jgi:glutathione S-transferase